MTMHCDDLDGLLLEGDAHSMAVAAEHARSCPACAETLAAWNDLSATARSLRTTWENDLHWPRIDRALRGAATRRSVGPWQIAAAVLLAVILAGGGLVAFRSRSEQAAFDRAILREQAIADVETTERAHQAAIDRLEKIAGPRLAEPQTPLMVSYREKLMLLDDAIGECQTSIRENRRNAHLRRQLLAVYAEKQKTLEDLLQEETPHVSNP